MPKETFSTSVKYSFYTPNSLRRKNLWLVNMRWISSLALMIFAFLLYFLKIDHNQFTSLASLSVVLSILNLLLYFFLKRHKPTYLKSEENFVLAQISVDYILLTYLIHLTGGIDSYFHFFYLFHIIIASVIFERKYSAFTIAAVAVILFTGLVSLEYLQIIKHVGHSILDYNPLDIGLALSVFYVTIFVSTYIGATLMMRHKKVKDLIFAQNEKLEKADKEKMLFFRFVSHELKTPLSTISVASSSLGNRTIMQQQDKVKELSGLIKRQNRHLSELIDRILDINIWEKDQVKLKPEHVPLELWIREVVNAFLLKRDKDSPEIRLNIHLNHETQVLAGCLDINASDKATRFIRFCDSFNIPLLTIADVPGYLPGSQQEWGGIIRHGAKLLWCYSEATVPKLLLVPRKDYGGSYLAMCSSDLGNDMAFAWPTAEIAVMGAAGAANIIHRREINNAQDPIAKRQEKIDEYNDLFSNPYVAASRGYIDAVIVPSETRPRLIDALEAICGKRETRPPKKHGNIPMLIDY